MNVIIAEEVETIAIKLMIQPEISGTVGDLGGIDISHFLFGSTVNARLGGQSETRLFHKICAALIGIGILVRRAMIIAMICTKASHIR